LQEWPACNVLAVPQTLLPQLVRAWVSPAAEASVVLGGFRGTGPSATGRKLDGVAGILAKLPQL